MAASDNQVVVAPAKADRIPVTFDRDDPRAMYLDTGVFEQLNRVAVALSQSELIPEQFRGKPADCLLLTGQAMRWNMDPLVCAQHAFVNRGKLGYEGKLVAAVINAELVKRGSEELDYEYTNVGNDRKITVSAKVNGRVKSVEGFVSKWKTDNKAWEKDPDQMLTYRGARQWARRYMPNILLGVASAPGEDESDIIDETERAKVIDVTTAIGAEPKVEEVKTRKRRTRAEIEAEEAKEAAEERARLEAAGQQRLPVVDEPKEDVEEAQFEEVPAETETKPSRPLTEETARDMLDRFVTERLVSDKQREWMVKRLDGLDELTSAKAVHLMNEQMLKQVAVHASLAAVWEAARKVAAAKYK